MTAVIFTPAAVWESRLPALPQLLLQVAVILAVARLAGHLMRRVGQPRVIGEMLAGILLGPSVLGWIAPGVAQALFPESALRLLAIVSQVGLVSYMFLVGLELDLALLRGLGRGTATIGLAGIIVPFALGTALGFHLYPVLGGSAVGSRTFALFLGAAMSVTAFPVLARIVAERGLGHTRLGAVAIVTAAFDDVVVWGMLVAIVAAAGLDASLPLPVFVAFVAGVVTPRRNWLVPRLRRVHGVLAVVILPLFFAFTGLRTAVGRIEASGWAYGGLIVLTAVVGKLAGSAVAARASGLPWRDSWAIGTLMNTRGLMELVILNVGLELGILSPALFTLMVLMTLLTTTMTAPLLARILPAQGLGRGDRVDRDQQPVLLQ